MPIVPMKDATITNPYGVYRPDLYKGSNPYHTGIDLVSSNTKIYCANGGEVVTAGEHKILGRRVWIFDGRYYHLYAHMKEFYCKEGQEIRTNDVIGEMGHTGNVSSSSGGKGDHLHYEIRTNPSSKDYAEDVTKYLRIKNKEGNVEFMGEQVKPKLTKMLFCGEEIKVPSVNVEDHEYMWVKSVENLIANMTVSFDVDWNEEKGMVEINPKINVR